MVSGIWILTRSAAIPNGDGFADLTSWQDEVLPVTSWSPDEAFHTNGSTQGYIGSEKCRRCHEDQFKSYSLTAHSRSFSSTDPNGAPENAGFEHPRSSRRYRVFRDEGKLIHQETLVGIDGSDLAVTSLPIRYTVGSGTHALTFLSESSGFYLESPVSWFRGTGWAMSPGYDSPSHPSFSRVVDQNCLFCHVGMIEQSKSNEGKFRVVEQSIGCERCHGPGAAHADRHETSGIAVSDTFSGVDPIVNPAELSRDLSEAICQQCHLQAAVYANGPGQTVWDYRPGQPVSATRTDFQFQDNTQFDVAGHVEQMHGSECYLKSETLTCITCHDPHHQPPQGDLNSHYRDVCVQCHQPNACGIELEARNQANHNSCHECHMPKQPIGNVHSSLHQHRIGVYPENVLAVKGSSNNKGETKLVPIVNEGEIPQKEMDRRLVLAIDATLQSGTPFERIQTQAGWSVKEAFRLASVSEPDVAVQAMAARRAMTLGQPQVAVALAQRVAESSKRGSRQSITALEILAEQTLIQEDNPTALQLYRELTALRMVPNDWYIRGICERNAGNVDEAIDSFRRALAIKPDLVLAHQALQSMFANTDSKLADTHFRLWRALERLERKSSVGANSK
ncbi:multiheme c-type cytochrome [Neorhodopirellula lusitana]|uniref:multiheme c-type cytochrome n=1 Tax=Neorhodopirellula lusitana TaxID=445327 RepID=UPI0024B80EC5|nr:multiheme c-type cytochrome [Neorhodopirellula lusitana]